jgi:GTP cyclohydrolase I
LQNQERLTVQIADAINDILRPRGVAVVIEAQHFCMCYRGVKKPGAWTTTSKLHGVFLNNPATRAELFDLIRMRRGQ